MYRVATVLPFPGSVLGLASDLGTLSPNLAAMYERHLQHSKRLRERHLHREYGQRVMKTASESVQRVLIRACESVQRVLKNSN